MTDELQRRLAWCHGSERAAEIMAGKDAAANRDLASWKRIADRGEPVADWSRNAVRVARLAAQDLRE